MQKVKRTVTILLAMGMLIGARSTLAYPGYWPSPDTSLKSDVAQSDVIAVVTIGPNMRVAPSEIVADGIRLAPAHYVARIDQLIKVRTMGWNASLGKSSTLHLRDNLVATGYVSGALRYMHPLRPGPTLVLLKSVNGKWQIVRQSPIRNGSVSFDGGLANSMSLERQIRVIEQQLEWKDTAKFAPLSLLSPRKSTMFGFFTR